MPEFMLLKEIGLIEFKIFLSVDYDGNGNIETQEFSGGKYWYGMPSDLIFANIFCNESTQKNGISSLKKLLI